MEDELNVKDVVFKEDMEDFTVYTFKPNFRALGPKVGKNMGAVKGALTAMNGRQAKAALDK